MENACNSNMDAFMGGLSIVILTRTNTKLDVGTITL